MVMEVGSIIAREGESDLVLIAGAKNNNFNLTKFNGGKNEK